MAFFEINNIKISGIAACVPKQMESNEDFAILTQEEREKLIQTTGIKQRRISEENCCTSDLCFFAAEQIIESLKWDKAEIDCLIFVTQTPDYILPATSCILQKRLGLKSDCYVLDVSLGCSGWIYGLSTIASFLSSSGLEKGLLLAGDTISKICSKKDKSTYPLFGDAGTATAVERSEKSKLQFQTSVNGDGFETIIIQDGAYRNIASQDSFISKQIEDGIYRNRLQLVLDGMDVFSFGISKAPQSVNSLIDHFGLNKDTIDYFVFHQANLFMNENIRKKLKLPKEKVPHSLKDFGNTSSATIPLTIVTQLGEDLSNSKKEIIACGFGVGLSWGSVHFTTENIICSKLVEM